MRWLQRRDDGFGSLRDAVFALKRWRPAPRTLLRTERERIERRLGHRPRTSERIGIWLDRQRWYARTVSRWVVAARPTVLRWRRIVHRHRRALMWSFIVAACLIVPAS